MLISQIKDKDGRLRVVAREGSEAYAVKGAASVYALALEAASRQKALKTLIGEFGLGEAIDLEAAYDEGRLLLPVTHPDPAHMHITGTGLTHLGSASTRDAMHAGTSAEDDEKLSDSMKMFRIGLEGGKPADGYIGAQPEWFYKGNGVIAVAPGAPLISPNFAYDGGEEPEITGIYIIGEDGMPYRIGFALANEFSDHVLERTNYLYLAHSKLRSTSFGPEILIGELPEDIRGASRIYRSDSDIIWEKPFLSGEMNMSHSIANLEHHHFKYELFRQPGEIHIHMFGTATLSFADGIRAQDGDIFEIAVPEFGLPLRNPITVQPKAKSPEIYRVAAL